jgi:hypothetical protein
LLVDLLRYNDEFNNSFKTFESYMQERERRVGPSQPIIANSQSSPTKVSSSPRKQDNEPALIKFDDDPSTLSPTFQNIRSYRILISNKIISWIF